MKTRMILLAGILTVHPLGCMTMKTPTKKLSAEDFLGLYGQPGTPGDYWEYKGLNHGRYWLFHYGFRQPQQSVVSLLEKGYVAEQEMPNDFPSAPQPRPTGDNGQLKDGVERWMREVDPGSQKKQ